MSKKVTRSRRACHAVFGSALLALSHQTLAEAPVGVRPCCAFGKDLKAQVGSVPVPFFSVGNVLAMDEIGEHKYNDGSERVSTSLLGMGAEKNGLIYTARGGFIDTAHVRDTADFTYYLFGEIRQHLGKQIDIVLPSELRQRVIVLKANTTQLDDNAQRAQALHIAALTAFRLAQWHEIAQWFGMESVGGFKELASAFSPEDLYSNMLGATLASEILRQSPDLDVKAFGRAMDTAMRGTLMELQAAPAEETDQRIEALDGVWWDSSKRLPDKWVLLARDYDLALTLDPNGVAEGRVLSLSESLPNGDALADWAGLELRAEKMEASFSALPASLRAQTVWTPAAFQPLADFARQSDHTALPSGG